MSGLFGPIQDMLQGAIQGLDVKRQTVAQNIANVNTPGYKAQDVQFAATLNQALATGSVQPQVVTSSGSMRPDGNNVDLVQQLGLANQVTLVEQGVMNVIDADMQEVKSVATTLG